MPETPKQWLGAVALVAGVIVIPWVFVLGLMHGKVLNPFLFGMFTANDASLYLLRSEAPRRFWAAMIFWGLLVLCVIWLLYALAFLRGD